MVLKLAAIKVKITKKSRFYSALQKMELCRVAIKQFSPLYCVNLTSFGLALVTLFFMLRSFAKLKLPTNLDAISKNVKNLQIGPVEPKL